MYKASVDGGRNISDINGHDMKHLLLRVLRLSIIITTIITIVFSFLGSQDIMNTLIISGVFSLSITAFAVTILSLARPRIESWAPAVKSISLIFLIIISAVLGTVTGALGTYFFYPDFHFLNYIQLFIKFNIIAALIFGGTSLVFYRIYHKYEQSVNALHQEEINRLRVEQQKTFAELKAIQAQVNPHFLFNALNSLATLIKLDTGKALDMVHTLSDYYRQILSFSEQMYITMEQEISLVENYLRIEKVRFGERLRYNINVVPEMLPVTIPSMLIQPLVENAVKYSISPRIKGGTIQVNVRETDDQLEIVVHDDGPGFDPEQTGKGHGIDLVRNKLNLCYGEGVSVRINSKDGTTITILIPEN